jgi:hypothetical protein
MICETFIIHCICIYVNNATDFLVFLLSGRLSEVTQGCAHQVIGVTKIVPYLLFYTLQNVQIVTLRAVTSLS